MLMEAKKKRPHEGLLIPEELITDILSCLPVKTLMRFKLVSKSWNSLISDSHFVKLHLRRCSAPNANPRVMFLIPPDSIGDIKYLPVKSLLKTPSATDLQYLRPTWKDLHFELGSCNGLICVIGFATDHYSKFDHEQQLLFWITFWNPATRSTSQKWFTLPMMCEHVEDYHYATCGFGYDHVSDTYKAMLVLEKHHQAPVIVYNKGDYNWRHVGYFPPDLMTKDDSTVGVHFNGTLNWFVTLKIHEHVFDDYEIYEYSCIEWDNGSCMILSFDLNKEEFVRLSFPAMSHKFYDPQLGVLGGCLCASHYDEQGTNFMIWQMKEFGVYGSWTKLLNINYDKELKPRDLEAPFRFPLYMFDNGDILMLPESLLYVRRDNRVVSLDVRFKSYASCAVICCESLVSSC